MLRTNDPFWSRQGARAGLTGQNRGPERLRSWNGLGLVRAMALPGGQIGLFMKQSQPGFMNSPG